MIADTNGDFSYDRDAALAEWNKTRTGPLVVPTHLNHILYVRLPDDAAPFSQQGFVDPTAGENAPHLGLLFSQISSHLPASSTDRPVPPGGTGNVTVQILAANLHPTSRESSLPSTYALD